MPVPEKKRITAEKALSMSDPSPHGDKADSTIILTADSASIWQATKRC